MKINFNWKKLFCFLLGIICLLQIDQTEVKASAYWPQEPETESLSAIVMELSTGTILYEKNITESRYPASITKILTTLVALENSDLNEVVTFSDRAIDETRGGSGIARDYGEQMTMEQCLYGVMLASSNECAFAVAEHVGGTMENFVAMMNEKAKELGCVNTHFTNPHGLPDENHWTCAYDMALISQAAYENETFRIITGTARYTIPPTNKHEEQTDLQNHNEMLYPFKHNYVYEYCTGGKTGFTTAANSTLVTFAEKDGMQLVCVVLDVQAPGHWSDSRALFDYTFDNFQLVNIVDNETRYSSAKNKDTGSLNTNDSFVEISENANIVLPKAAEFSDTTSEISYDQTSNDIVGTIVYTYAGHQVGTADITKTNAKVNGFGFDNQTEEQQETAAEEADTDEDTKVNTPQEADTDDNSNNENKEAFRIQIKPTVVAIVIIVIVVLLILLFLLKKFVDNYYIIRHNMEVRRLRKQQFKTIKSNRKRRRRRR